MAVVIGKAVAIVEVHKTAEALRKAIKFAQDKGVSESDLMELLNINLYSLTKFLED